MQNSLGTLSDSLRSSQALRAPRWSATTCSRAASTATYASGTTISGAVDLPAGTQRRGASASTDASGAAGARIWRSPAQRRPAGFQLGRPRRRRRARGRRQLQLRRPSPMSAAATSRCRRCWPARVGSVTLDRDGTRPHPQHPRARRQWRSAHVRRRSSEFRGAYPCHSVSPSAASTPPQTDLDVTANNIANAQTTGFKESRAEFADLFAVSPQGVSRTQIGNGVQLAAVSQQFTQGNIEFTDNSLDLAISGQGFFVAERQRRAGLYARRRLPDRQRRLRRQRRGPAPAGVSADRRRRLQHRRAGRPAARSPATAPPQPPPTSR